MLQYYRISVGLTALFHGDVDKSDSASRYERQPWAEFLTAKLYAH